MGTMYHALLKDQKRALRDAAALAHPNDREMTREDVVVTTQGGKGEGDR
jgi:hypothetical protein